MRYLPIIISAMLSTTAAMAADTTASKPVNIKGPLIQAEIGAGAGFIFPGAVESSYPEVRAFRAGTFLFNSHFNLNRNNRKLYFSTSVQFGLMPFSTSAFVPGPTPKPSKPLLDIRHEYMVFTVAVVPTVQLQLPVSSTTRFYAGAGAGPMLMMHAHIDKPQRNIMLEANTGLMLDNNTGIGLRFLRPYEGLKEENTIYTCNYKLTGVLLDFRHRLSKPARKPR
jgi:hypothetical protein